MDIIISIRFHYSGRVRQRMTDPSTIVLETHIVVFYILGYMNQTCFRACIIHRILEIAILFQSAFLYKLKNMSRMHMSFIPVVLLYIVGIVCRFLVSKLGNNYDFESYQIVGDIVSSGGNVYFETTRYNYSPLFSYFLGAFYSLSSVFTNSVLVFRYLIIAFITVFDIIVSQYIRKNSNVFLSLVYFLNPVSIIITGYHNQFDIIAVAFTLLSKESIIEAQKNKARLSKYDIYAVVFLALSLLFKHLAFLIPIWILMNVTLPLRRRVFISVLPPTIFIASFIPYLEKGLPGIVRNVFLYRSFNNMPIICYSFLNADNSSFFRHFSRFLIYLFVFSMIYIGYVIKQRSIDNVILIYFISLVCFSSAITNQYLVIPIVSLIVLSKVEKYYYIFFSFVFLLFDKNGLDLCRFIDIGNYTLSTIILFYLDVGYSILVWILLIFIVHLLSTHNKDEYDMVSS